MSWERALQADARLAAKNSVLIRAALRQSVNWENAFRGYEATTPDTTLSLPQQRTRARAWAIINIRVNLEPFKEVLYRVWADAYALGNLAAREQIELAREARKQVTTGVDWDNWKPGDARAAILLKPPRGFQYLLEDQGITFKDFSDSTLSMLGNAIGEAIELGLDARTSAKLIMNHVASPARALTIAITEQNRAISQATKERYMMAGVQRMEWLVFDPCKICAVNENVKVVINQPFPSGNTQPPAHPNCRCALAPVIPGMDEVDQAPGATIVTPPVTTPVSREELTTLLEEPEPVIGAFKPGEWKELTKDEIRESVISLYVAKTGKTREAIELYIQKGFIGSGDLELLRNGTVYRNGPIEIQFYASGAKVKADERKKFLESVDAIQTYAPKDKMIITVAKEKKGAYGSAILGDAQIFLRPSVVSDNLPKEKELGFKMPVIAEVAHRDYVLAHEWGHSIDIGGSFGRTVSIQNPATKETIKRLQKKYANDPLAIRSGYSGENTKEFYAEMFAEWYLTKGTTKNPLVQEMAQALGWAKFTTRRSGATSNVTERAEQAPAYVNAKQTEDYWNNDKLIDMYGTNAKGNIDFGSYNRNGQNIFLRNILEEQGFNGKPTVVVATEFQKYVDQGALPLYRGVAAETAEQVDEYVTQYLKDATPFIGKGMFGDGTYFGSKREIGENFAKVDRQGNPISHGKVIEAVLDPRAKIITLEEVNDYIRKNKEKMYDLPQDFYEDPSAVAASLGYDAIKITNPKVNWTDPTAKPIEADYYIVLNRTAVIIKEML